MVDSKLNIQKTLQVQQSEQIKTINNISYIIKRELESSNKIHMCVEDMKASKKFVETQYMSQGKHTVSAAEDTDNKKGSRTPLSDSPLIYDSFSHNFWVTHEST